MKNIFLLLLSIIYIQTMAQDIKPGNIITEEQVLQTLDNSNNNDNIFVQLSEPYSYLIDTRLNVFRSDTGEWAIAIERLGYNPRGGFINLDIYYYRNCLLPLENFGTATNSYTIYPINHENFESTTDGENLKTDSQFWLVRGQQVMLSKNKNDYQIVGIELNEYEPNAIRIEEAARLAIIKNSDLFRATDSELYKAIPKHLKKILVLDQWYHKDFVEIVTPTFTDEKLRQTYDVNKSNGALSNMSFEDFSALIKSQEKSASKLNKKNKKSNSPSSYETWQQLAKVIANNNSNFYKPKLKPNTHWKNWPESGSL